MPKYVMSHLKSNKFRTSSDSSALRQLDTAFRSLFSENVRVLRDNEVDDKDKRRIIVFEADSAEVEAKKRNISGDVIIEPEIPHYTEIGLKFYSMCSPFVSMAQDRAVGDGEKLVITCIGGDGPLRHTGVTLLLRNLVFAAKISGMTSDDGQVTFNFNPSWIPTALFVLPAGGFWSVMVRGPEDQMRINIPRLPQTGPLAWWHRAIGIHHIDNTRGAGIKVGVIDTGVGPHELLSHVTSVGSFINAIFDPHGGADAESHGSHVCGIIGARSTNDQDISGIAPGADLFCARVFPPDGAANQGDIADAIDALLDHEVDLINLSLGSVVKSGLEEDAIQDALERGALCICAAGNSAGSVHYPAAFVQTVAVSALGLEGWGPDGTLAASCQPADMKKFGLRRLFLANFSCFGQIGCCAPGVGIISTVPERHGLVRPYSAMDGTSMASPVVCGALAATLAGSQAYRSLPRDETRAEMARTLLRTSCEQVGMEPEFQGWGMPKVAV